MSTQQELPQPEQQLLLAWLLPSGSRCSTCARNLTEQCVHFNRVAFLCHDFGQYARSRSWNFHCYLVGFQFHQRFIDSDSIADLLEPLSDGCLSNGLPKRGNANFGSHGFFFR